MIEKLLVDAAKPILLVRDIHFAIAAGHCAVHGGNHPVNRATQYWPLLIPKRKLVPSALDGFDNDMNP
jgi:hypothetical protein